MRILLVDDERRMAEALQQVLHLHDYTVDLAFDGQEAIDKVLTYPYDVIVLDIMLPKINGIGVLQRIRDEQIGTPVILLTAKGETEDKVAGLDAGADDYLAKPFQTSELLARLRALTRRRGDYMYGNGLVFEDLEFNPETLDLSVGERSFRLTLKESQLLEILMVNHDLAVGSSTIIEKIWGFDLDVEDSRVQVYISFLRKKLSELRSRVIIQTIRGVGYVLRKGVDARDQETAQ